MEKNPFMDFPHGESLMKLWRIMRLTLFLIFTSVITVLANNSYAQSTRLDIQLNNGTVKEVLSYIEDNSDFVFLYNNEDLDVNRRVRVNLKNASINEILKEVLRGQDVSFEIYKRQIVIHKNMDSGNPITQQSTKTIVGKVTDSSGTSVPGVTVVVKGTNIGTITDSDGNYSLEVNPSAETLVFSFVGMKTREVNIGSNNVVNVRMEEASIGLDEIVAVGYGVQKKSDLTGAIASVNSKDLESVHGGSTVSTGLAGKIAGVTFREPDGRPGSSATIQIRNMGDPLYVIDGIEEDVGQFNNLSPNDIESITVLKDASAAIYGVKAANGVVVVTTKRGKRNTKSTVNVDAYQGWQNWTAFPKVSNAYQWNYGKVEADVNSTGKTAITPDQLAKYKAGTEAGYKSFDWYKFIVTPNMPQSSVNVNVNGGSKNINYYFSVTHLDQSAVLRQYKFSRTNIQSNIDANISKNLTVGTSINGRIESRVNPGVPGGDDYWAPRFAILRNTPMDRPYANDNPKYMNNIGHNDTNWALMNYASSGKFSDVWYVLQTNFHAEYKLPVKGLSMKGVYSYYYADELKNNHEFTYDAYTYNPTTQTYDITGGSQNPWQERGTTKITDVYTRGELNYKNSFGHHNIDAVFAAERDSRVNLSTWLHDVPALNDLDIIQFSTMDTYDDSQTKTARIGYIGRISYNYNNKYYVEVSGRRDASSIFAPDKRWGFFPSVSGGWRISSEKFYEAMPNLKNILNDLKFRASYGKLGDDNNGISSSDFVYISGYTYPSGATTIFDGNPVLGARDRGLQTTNLTWYVSRITDIGVDFSLFNSKVNGSADYFYRKRTGLRGHKYDVLLPEEVGFSLPDENVNSDAQMGQELVLNYNGQIRKVKFTVGGNVSYSRRKNLATYKPMFGNSWDYYRNSTENRWDGIVWGYQAIGHFQSQDQINNYPVNIDGQGNKTLLPGDLIYKDQNGDGVINQYDQRPIGYPEGQQPILNFGFQLAAKWNGFDFKAEFSGGGMYTYERHWEMMWPYQNGGNLLKEFYDNSWHRVDPYDVNSEWIAGKYPALRFNDGAHSNYEGMGATSSFWLTKVRYLRLRTMELGYTVPKSLIEKLKIQKLRFYVNTYNLFSIDNTGKFGVDPEVMDANGMQYPQEKYVNIGVNLTF